MSDRPLYPFPSGSYFEDENGVPDFVNVRQIGGPLVYPVAITEAFSEETDATLRTAFFGQLDALPEMVEKDFAVHGRVRDQFGGITDLSAQFVFRVIAGEPPSLAVYGLTEIVELRARIDAQVVLRTASPNKVSLITSVATNVDIAGKIRP